MLRFVFCMLFFFLFSNAIPEWVELPKVAPFKSTGQNTSDLQNNSTTSKPISPNRNKTTSTLDFIKITEELPQKTALKNKNDFVPTPPNKLLNLSNIKIDDSKEESNDAFVEEVKSGIEDFNVIKETLKEAEKDVFNAPKPSIQGKLQYLQQLQNTLNSQIRRLSQGLWMDRQARGKKLMGFASMEGALMTIAFLTFAVFLIKVVHLFIQGLQQHELMMTVALPPTATASAATTVVRHRSYSRRKREQTNLAAAQLLRYMDEYSIKHRLHCDYPQKC